MYVQIHSYIYIYIQKETYIYRKRRKTNCENKTRICWNIKEEEVIFYSTL